MTKYLPSEFEQKWIKYWEVNKIYKTSDSPQKKYYCLDMYPYPSGSGLHVGHPHGYLGTDVISRYKRMEGYDVLHPIGFDSFGLPAENFAIKTGTPPEETTNKSIEMFKSQIRNIGLSYDWDRVLSSHDPRYYKWTQWLFLQMYKKGIAYKKKAPVNWCPKDQTVLANEQVIDGKCERCDTAVIQKDMDQWFFKITNYVNSLDEGLERLDWPEGTKLQQKNWIGKSEGAEIFWKVENNIECETIKTFTTRADTIPGATFIVLAPEFPRLNQIVTSDNKLAVNEYILKTKTKTELERQTEKEKTGVFTGSYAINPFNGEKLPIYVADYVLAGYGTGAVMGMPGHDKRDFEFAKKFNIAIKHSLKPKNVDLINNQPYEGEGHQINSGEFDGLWWEDAKEKILDKLAEEGNAQRITHYRLRDWLISRQRYWGCPIPIVYDPEGNAHPLEESELPLLLPTDVDFKPTGESPITRSASFKRLAEEKYGKGWHFEVDTMDTFVDSSWYYFRYTDVNNDEVFASKEEIQKWMPVDLYVGGSEHAVLHLLYSRFFTKFLKEEGYIDFEEPFIKLRHQGIILANDGRKMSKRWGNVINPDDEIEKYGADTLRVYEMFMGPFSESKSWDTKGEIGVYRFLNKIWNLKEKVADVEVIEQEINVNKLVKKVTEDTEKLSFNTAVAKFMEFVNFLQAEQSINRLVWETFLKLLAPYAPFITEELWNKLGYNSSIHLETWPEYDNSVLESQNAEIGVQINGKLRGVIQISKNAEETEALSLARNNDSIKRYLTEEPKKIIYVKGRILNIIL
jgi:leucyl-tRNA synthetase